MWQTLISLCLALSGQTPRRRAPHRRPAFRRPLRPAPHRPRLEALEDRTVLSPYVVNTTADSGAGSLRDAVAQINAYPTLYASLSSPGVDEIDFNLPWNDPGHLYYRDDGAAGHVTLGNAVPVPAVALDGITPITSDAQLADPNLVGAGNTIDPDWANSWWSIHLQSTISATYPNSGYSGQPVILDGYSQPGASPNTSPSGDNAILRVEVNGSQMSAGWGGPYFYGTVGFHFPVSNSVVRGITFNGFDTPDPTSGFPAGATAAHRVETVFTESSLANVTN